MADTSKALSDLLANLPKGKKGKRIIPFLPMLAEILAVKQHGSPV